jgi:hypothetical protein
MSKIFSGVGENVNIQKLPMLSVCKQYLAHNNFFDTTTSAQRHTLHTDFFCWNYYKCNNTRGKLGAVCDGASWVRPVRTLVSAELLASTCNEASPLCHTAEDPTS